MKIHGGQLSPINTTAIGRTSSGNQPVNPGVWALARDLTADAILGSSPGMMAVKEVNREGDGGLTWLVPQLANDVLAAQRLRSDIATRKYVRLGLDKLSGQRR